MGMRDPACDCRNSSARFLYQPPARRPLSYRKTNYMHSHRSSAQAPAFYEKSPKPVSPHQPSLSQRATFVRIPCSGSLYGLPIGLRIRARTRLLLRAAYKQLYAEPPSKAVPVQKGVLRARRLELSLVPLLIGTSSAHPTAPLAQWLERWSYEP